MRSACLAVLAAFIAARLAAQSPCKVEGVWELESGSADGKAYAVGIHEMKMIANGHFAVFWRDPGTPKELKTVADTLAAFRSAGSGGGRYTVQGSTYTEKIEYFVDPAYIGKSIAFTCRVDGDRFRQTGSFPMYEGGKKVRDSKLDEVWKRVP
jgi:hypothetical protein